MTILSEHVSPAGHWPLALVELVEVGSHMSAWVTWVHSEGATQATLAAEDVPLPSVTQHTVPAGEPAARQSRESAQGTGKPLSFAQSDALSHVSV